MSALALDAAPAVEELELKVPGGGGPGDIGSDGGGGGGGGEGGDEDGSRRSALQRLGILLGTVSIFSFFTALSIIFIVRSRTLFHWTPVEVPKTLWLSTALLLASSGWLEMARRALARRNVTAYRERLLATSLLGLAFLACQCVSMYQLAGQGLFARGNPHAALFYFFTAIHGAHLLGGLIAVNWLVMHSRRTWVREAGVSGNIAFYWHFMSVIWLGLFGLLLAL
jgi:cytochrome c oxidase subunit III